MHFEVYLVSELIKKGFFLVYYDIISLPVHHNLPLHVDHLKQIEVCGLKVKKCRRSRRCAPTSVAETADGVQLWSRGSCSVQQKLAGNSHAQRLLQTQLWGKESKIFRKITSVSISRHLFSPTNSYAFSSKSRLKISATSHVLAFVCFLEQCVVSGEHYHLNRINPFL